MIEFLTGNGYNTGKKTVTTRIKPVKPAAPRRCQLPEYLIRVVAGAARRRTPAVYMEY